MALVDLKSDLSWYGKKPVVNYIQNNNAKGFTANQRELGPSQFTGVSGIPGGMQYQHTGNKDLGKIAPIDAFANDNANGFTINQQPLSPSLFTGIGGVPGSMFYLHNGIQGLGNLGTTNYFEDITAEGFTPNAEPLGGGKLPSQFTGVGETSLTFTHNGPKELGVLREGYTPNANREDTHFSLNEDNTVTVDVKGFDNQGFYTIGRNITSEDGFAIDQNSLSDRGIAKRKSQGGSGHPFSNYLGFGPYNWKPSAHLGWHIDNKYGDFTGNQTEQSNNANYGLALTYTENSPIEDVYNKLNLRDDATPNPGYVKQPFDLRGIQKEGRTDPSRYGFGSTTFGKIFSTFGLPRSGILTSVERSAIDALRIGKFLISPKGIGFLARQFGYQLMNPNTENEAGNATKLPKPTQIYNPLSAPGQALVGGVLGTGKFTRHTALTKLPRGGGGEYGGTKNLQRASNIVTGMGENAILGLPVPALGRMMRLLDQYKQGDGFIGQQWGALSAYSGPGSILGIGRTIFKRTTFTDLKNQSSPYGGLPAKDPSIQSLLGTEGVKTTYNTSFGEKFFRYRYGLEYEDSRFAGTEGRYADSEITDDNLDTTTYKSETESGIKFYEDEDFQGGGQPNNLPEGQDTPATATEYSRMAYGKVLELSKARTVSTNVTSILDFGKKSPVADPNYNPKTMGNGKNYLGKDNFFGNLQTINQIEGPAFNANETSPGGLVPLRIESKYISQDTGDTTKAESNIISFRAYISSFNDSFAPGFDSTPDQGRADPRYQYTSFERNVSLDFIVAAQSKTDFDIQWRKLSALARLTYPIYSSNKSVGFYGDYCLLTIGKMFNSMPAYITDLSYDWDNETPWEINTDRMAPFYTNVSISFNILHKSRPQSNSEIYGHIRTPAPPGQS